MKNKILKYNTVVIILFFLVSIFFTAHAEESTTTKQSQEEFIKSMQPVNRGEVTIKKEEKKIKKIIHYNLSSNDKKVNISINKYILPYWMNTSVCDSKDVSSIFFGNNNSTCNENTDTGEGMNSFSNDFFSDIISNTKKDLLESEKSLNSSAKLTVDSSDETVNLEEDSNTESKNNVKTTEIEDIGSIFNGLNISLDDVSEVVEGSSEELKTVISTALEGGEEKEDIIDEPQVKTSTGIVVGDISSGDKLNTSVDKILEKFLDPDEYIKPEKTIDINKEMVVEEEVIENEDIERDVELSELFPHIYINSDINSFTQKLFGPEVKDIMYGAKIDSDLLSGVSKNYLAISLEKFRAQKEILVIGGNQIFGLKGLDYYNKSVTDLYEKFLLRKPTSLEQKTLAKNISAISFSFSTYSNSTINFKTRDVFKNKLILDFQKLEKEYNNISKQNIIRNFLLRR